MKNNNNNNIFTSYLQNALSSMVFNLARKKGVQALDRVRNYAVNYLNRNKLNNNLRFNYNRFTNRRNNQNNKSSSMNGIEINRNDGGWKNVGNGYRIIAITIDKYITFYGRQISAGKYNYYLINNGTFSNSYDLSSITSDSEFIKWENIASQVKFLSYGMTIDYCRAPKAAEVFPELYVNIESELVDSNLNDAFHNPETMTLDMTKPGKKILNIRINRQNTMIEHVNWQNIKSFTAPKMLLQFAPNDIYLDETATNVRLGTIKTWARVLLRIPDMLSSTKFNIELKDKEKEELKEIKTDEEGLIEKKEENKNLEVHVDEQKSEISNNLCVPEEKEKEKQLTANQTEPLKLENCNAYYLRKGKVYPLVFKHNI